MPIKLLIQLWEWDSKSFDDNDGRIELFTTGNCPWFVKGRITIHKFLFSSYLVQKKNWTVLVAFPK